VIGRPFTEVLQPWQEIIDDYRNGTNIGPEITLGDRCFDLRVKPLTNRRGDIQGRVIMSCTIFRSANRWQQEREQLIASLQNALSEVKKLSGLLPICANCKKIRDDQGYWQDVAVYIRDHSEAEFTHGICPDCYIELYPELAQKRKGHRDGVTGQR
jgi:hypothetical protein